MTDISKDSALTRPMPRSFSLVPTTFSEAKEMAAMIANSDFAPKDYKNKPENVIIAIQMGADLGLKPMQSLQNIAVINGRPSIWGDAALALAMPSLERFVETFEGEKGADTYTAVCTAKRRGWPDETVRKFSVGDAKAAKLWGKTGRDGQATPWVTYPYRMLALRARGFCLRDCAADLLVGLILAEEAEDYPDAIPGTVIASEIVPSPFEGVDPDLIASIEKGFEAVALTPGLRVAKVQEYLGKATSAQERGSQAAKLLEWLKDEYSRVKTGASRKLKGDTNGKGKPTQTGGQEAGSQAPTSHVKPSASSGAPASVEAPVTAADIPFAKPAVDPKLSF